MSILVPAGSSPKARRRLSMWRLREADVRGGDGRELAELFSKKELGAVKKDE
jgi:hypothetical protein